MLFEDTYTTLKRTSEFSLREKASKFIAYAYPINNETEAKEYIAFLKKQYSDANHHCYAYILGISKDIYRTNDDGEPSNSAGKPILRAIQSAGVSDTLVVVVRYFGGTLLGVPGLIQAYGEAARQALELAGRSEKMVSEEYTTTFDYSLENAVFMILKKQGAKIHAIEKSTQVTITFSIRKSAATLLCETLNKLGKTNIKFIRLV